jgi:LPXTG-motif cell wall-anchored protein
VRTRFAALLTVAATLAALAGTATVGAQVPVTDQAFAGYGSGAAVSANVLQLGATQTLNVQQAAAGQSTNSQGLPDEGLFNELGYVVQPQGISDRNAFGRGTGAELGLVTPVPNPDPNQILLAGLAEAAAPPNSGLVEEQIGPVELGSVLYANLLRGRAQATFDPNICVIGKPFSYGEGEAAGAQLVGTDPGAGLPLVDALLGVALPPDSPNPRNASSTRSATYLIPNGDGTFGVVSETRQTIAPVSLIGGAVTLELLGEWALRAIATGKPGGARIEYAPVGAGPSTPVATLTVGGTQVLELTFQDIFGTSGFDTEALLGALAAVLDIKIGTPPRLLGGGPGGGAPAVAADGTSASASVDVASVQVLTVPGVISGADIRLGHMEAAAIAPPGGVQCNIPVAKEGRPDPVRVGQDFTITIRIPSDAALYEELFGCDLININAVDVHTVESGNARFELTGASHGGQISADGSTVTFQNLGNYRIGDPPIELTVNGRIPGNSGAGRLKDVVTVTASLGNCTGTGAGEDIVGQAIGLLTNTGVVGTFTLIGPEVTGGVLAATGNNQSWLLIGGGVLLLSALAVRRRVRRPARTDS